MEPIRLTHVSFEMGPFRRKRADTKGDCCWMRDVGDALAVVVRPGVVEFSLSWDAIAAHRLEVRAFAEGTLVLEAPFVARGARRTHVVLSFANDQLGKVEALLQRHDIAQRTPHIPSLLLGWPLRLAYVPWLRSAVGALEQALPVLLLLCSVVELAIRAHADLSAQSVSAALHAKAVALVSAIYYASPTWLIVALGVALLPAVPLLWMWWMLVFFLAFFHQWVTVGVFAIVAISNIKRALLQIRSIARTTLALVAYLRRAVTALVCGKRAPRTSKKHQ